jgi:hypothetical protein
MVEWKNHGKRGNQSGSAFGEVDGLIITFKIKLPIPNLI